MIIRPEEPKDRRAVEELTREAFWNVYRPGCTEHYILNRFRSDLDFIPELNLVMEESGRIIGHVMYAKAEIVRADGSTIPAATFGPVSIHPDFQRRGYGLKLLQYSLEKARETGIGVICIEGNPDFYRHAGFIPASSLKLRCEGEEAESPYFLAQELIPGYLGGLGGCYVTPSGYFVADEAVEAFDALFPKKDKLVLPGQLF